MRKLQEEHLKWVTKKYPNQQPKIPAVGCLEEAGELVHALLKIEQILTWGEDNRHKLLDLRHKLVDAIGDCGIFACSLCNANGWDFLAVYDCEPSPLSNALDMAIILVQIATKLALHPQFRAGLRYYLSQLKAIAQILGLDLEATILTTWQVVKER